jgi:zinc transporter, ZIP family
MLPSAQRYLKLGGLSAGTAAYTTIGCFLGGVVVIQVVSRFLHHWIPSTIVDCKHSHQDEEYEQDGQPGEEWPHIDDHSPKQQLGGISEVTPLLTRTDTALSETTLSHLQNPRNPRTRLVSRVSNLGQGSNASCDEGGPCYGYSDPCAQECYKDFRRSSLKTSVGDISSKSLRQPSIPRNSTAPFPGALQKPTKSLDGESTLHQSETTIQPKRSTQTNQGAPRDALAQNILYPSLKSDLSQLRNNEDSHKSTPLADRASVDSSQPHHHHVAKNAFLAIGLQTSIAIALHKLPEGFITFATNHANPKLGFMVFMALFIHNITEGYAMALPLYLALESRWKSMFWSSLLGGISQPLGAGIAALWFKIAGNSDMTPGETVYGCMFAITAGVMTSVALQLFSESVDLTHNGNLCITFAFVGMGIMGLSFALTAC